MFSWKNLKSVVTNKIIEGETAKDKALGVAELVGKSLTSATTAIAKATPKLLETQGLHITEKSGEEHLEYFSKEKVKEREKRELDTYKARLEKLENQLEVSERFVEKLSKECTQLESEIEQCEDGSDRKNEIKQKLNENHENYIKKHHEIMGLHKKISTLSGIIWDYEMEDVK